MAQPARSWRSSLDVLELADRVWRGEAAAEEHLFSQTGETAEIAPGIGFIPSFGNVVAFECNGSLLLIDSGSPFTAPQVHEQVRRWTSSPLRKAIFTHGHIDHVSGLGPFEEEGERAEVISHAGVVRRFDRYRLTAGFNTEINRRQFGVSGLRWPTEFRYPDKTFHRALDVELGGRRFELRHAKGETDDHTWAWLPEERVICCGDFIIWACPNAGNPQKVQRYPLDWAQALREMATLGAETLLPGHGLPILGRDRVGQVLADTASLLEHLHDATIEMMNSGASLDEIIHTVRGPEELLGRPYLRPIYDEPEFIVRSVWRLYGGWWDGNPSRLKPAPDEALASALAELAGGAKAMAEEGRRRASQGDLRLACHLADLAALADPDDPEVLEARAGIYEQRAGEEGSVMARGIFNWAASGSRQRLASGTGEGS